jgi:hypothetical protein
MKIGNLKNLVRHDGFWRRLGESTLALTAGAGVGAGLMYLCDPNRGHSRRRGLMGEASELLHRDAKKLEKGGKHLFRRLRGVVTEAEAALAFGHGH